MNLKKTAPFLMGLSALIGATAHADGMNARVKTVDPVAHTITVLEGGKDYVYNLTETTKYTNAQGDVLATGFKIGDKDLLEAAVKAGVLKEGTRLSITYDKKDDQSVATEVKLRDKNRETHDAK